MTQQGGTFQRVTVAEAATILGVSPATVRRMVKAGRLTGERVIRPQGSAFVVLLPEDASVTPGGASATQHDAWRVKRSNAPPDASQETALAAWVVTLMAPLAEANARQHETIERQAGEVADLREQHGRLAVELVETKVRLVEAKVERDAAESSRRRDGRRLTIALAALAMLLVLALVAPAWVR